MNRGTRANRLANAAMSCDRSFFENVLSRHSSRRTELEAEPGSATAEILTRLLPAPSSAHCFFGILTQQPSFPHSDGSQHAPHGASQRATSQFYPPVEFVLRYKGLRAQTCWNVY